MQDTGPLAHARPCYVPTLTPLWAPPHPPGAQALVPLSRTPERGGRRLRAVGERHTAVPARGSTGAQ